MKRLWKPGGWSKPQRAESSRSLLKNNNNDTQDGNDQADKGYYNTFNNNVEQPLQGSGDVTCEKLAELLSVTPDANTPEDESCCSMLPETNSMQQNRRLIQRYVSQYFPQQPADLKQNLQQYLLDVKNAVCNDLVRQRRLMESMGLMGWLIDCYHRQTFDHLDNLLKNSHSSRTTLLLMKWVLHTYLSQELLNHPDLRELDLIKKVDLLLLTEWEAKAKDKLLEHVQTEVRDSLEKILQIERRQDGCNDEESYVRLYVDTIQCINAVVQTAQKISSKLSNAVWKVCFQELRSFLGWYTTEQTEILKKKLQMDKLETMHFFKTLKACKEFKQHIQAKSKGIRGSLLQETVEMLENMETVTLNFLMEIVADIAETHLKNYFKTENKEFFFLVLALKTYFPKLSWCQDIHKRVMNEAYKLIAHKYLQHLIRSSLKKLTKCWSLNVEQTITEDAQLLHATISDLAPGVQQWNLMLQKTAELLGCTSIVPVKLTVAVMQNECPTWSVDLDLLPALLRWKGLSRREVQEVLDALPLDQPIPRYAPWCPCLPCC